MAFSDLWSSRRHDRASTNSSTSLDDRPAITFEELEQKYDLVEVHDEPGKQFAVVADKRAASLTNELGSSSASPWTSFTRQEYNPALQGIRGLEMWDKMRKSDGAIRGTLRAVKSPVTSGRWFIDAGGTSKADETAAEFIRKMLFDYSKSISWTQVLTEALLMMDFGYYMFEKVWDFDIVDGQLRTVLKKLAPRHPMDVKEWVLDTHGGPRGVWMFAPNPTDDDVYIPIEKLLVFTFDREAGNIEGISVLRSAYKHWYFKEQLYKIDAIQKERHGIGIPVIKLPLGFTDADKLAAQELGRNIRTNERAHVVLPPGWDLFMLKLEGNPVNAMESIEHHNDMIRENILINFIRDGAREEDLVMFYKATRFVADIVCDAFNSYLIPQMIDLNFTRAKYPKLKVRRIGETADWRTLTFALRNLVGAGILIPDEPLEALVREEMDLPKIDKDTARLVATPQNPYDMNDEDEIDAPGANDDTHNNNNPNYDRRNQDRNRNERKRKRPGKKQRGQQAGLPRQSTVSGARNSFGLPRSNGGSDRSGG